MQNSIKVAGFTEGKIANSIHILLLIVFYALCSVLAFCLLEQSIFLNLNRAHEDGKSEICHSYRVAV